MEERREFLVGLRGPGKGARVEASVRGLHDVSGHAEQGDIDVDLAHARFVGVGIQHRLAVFADHRHFFFDPLGIDGDVGVPEIVGSQTVQVVQLPRPDYAVAGDLLDGFDLAGQLRLVRHELVILVLDGLQAGEVFLDAVEFAPREHEPGVDRAEHDHHARNGRQQNQDAEDVGDGGPFDGPQMLWKQVDRNHSSAAPRAARPIATMNWAGRRRSSATAVSWPRMRALEAGLATSTFSSPSSSPRASGRPGN